MSTMLHFILGTMLATVAPVAPVASVASVASVDSLRPAVRAAAPRTVVEVDNRNFNDANVWAVQGVHTVRLGTVTGLSTGTLVLPADMIATALPIRFVVRPLASRRSMLSDEILVSQGDTIGLVVSPF